MLQCFSRETPQYDFVQFPRNYAFEKWVYFYFMDMKYLTSNSSLCITA